MGMCRTFELPYQAVIMTVLETMSSRIVRIGGAYPGSAPPATARSRASLSNRLSGISQIADTVK